MLKSIQYLFLLLILFACGSSNENNSNDKPNLNLFSTTKLNLKEGYSIHSVTKDSIQPVINSVGKIIVTGKPIRITPKKEKAALEGRTYRDLGNPEIISTQENPQTYRASNIEQKIIDRGAINEIQLGFGKQSEKPLNASGEEFVTGRRVRVKPQIKHAINPPSEKTEQPVFKPDVTQNVRSLDVDQGLSSSYVHSITEDKFGRLYFGTYGNGLMIYDGHTVQSFSKNNGLSSNLIRKLFTDSKGNVWIGTENEGFSKYDGSSFTHYTYSNGFIGQNVYDILEDKEGNIWCATNNGISCFDGEEFIFYTEKEGIDARINWSICEDSKGRIWIGSDVGIVSCFNGEKFLKYGEDQGIKAGSILSLFEDSEGNIWISSMTNGLYRLSGSAITHFGRDQGLSGGVITSIREDRDHNIWFTSFGDGIFKFDGNYFTQYTEEHGLNILNYWCSHQDNSGKIWFGSEGGGVSVIQDNSFTHLTNNSALKTSVVWAIDNTRKDEMWISSYGAGLVQMRDQSYAYFSKEQGLSSNNVLSLLTDSKNNQWLGHWGQGVDLIKDGEITNLNSKNGFDSDNVFSIVEDKNENIWFATGSSGVIKYDGEYFQQISEDQGLGRNNVRTVFEDSKGNIWIATDGAGIAKYDGNSIIHYSEREGVCSNYIRCINEDSYGNIWIGTDLGGISIFTGEEFIHIGTNEGLTNNNIRTIDRVRDNLFAVGTEKGINLISLKKDAKDKIEVRLTTYKKNDGLKGIDVYLNTSHVDNQNRVWWATGKSLTSINSNDLQISKAHPKTLITGLDINQQPYDYCIANDSIDYELSEKFRNVPTKTTLKHSQNHLTFRFTGIEWSSPNEVKYSYRINDEKWSQPSRESKADYRNLSAGTHTFEVRSIGKNLVWSPADAITFEILPPWWKTWWAYLLYILLFISVIYGIYRYQLKRQLAMEEANRLREMDKMKTEFFTNISHEFRTPLTIITGLKDRLETNYKTRKDEAFQKNVAVLHKNGDQLLGLVNQLLDISKLEQGMMHLNIKEIDVYSTLKYELSSYGSTADQKEIELDLNCSETNLTVLADEKAFLNIFHNLIGNALKFTQRGVISVAIEAKDESTVQISIRDTGIGIAEDDLPQIFDRFYQVDNSDTKEYQGSGIGLSHVQKLIELQGAKIQVESELNLGTTFTMSFPRGNNLEVPDSIQSDLSNSEDLNLSNSEVEDDSRPKLLIVEDNEDMRYFIATILEDDYSITTASDGVEGLAIAQKLVPDFIISDWMMPKMTGPEMLQELKANVSTSHIPMMLLTARADQESKIEGYEHGADAYLTKPFESKELRVRIKVLIDTKKRLQDFYSAVEVKELAQSENRPKLEDAFILKTLEFVKEKLGDSELSGDSIAEQHNLSRSQFARKLRTLTGKSVTEFIRNLRLEEAKRLLDMQELNVSEIAYEIGYSDPAYFTRVFTKETGVAPSNWNVNS